MFGEHITLGQGVIVCVFSMAVVFLVLWALTKMIGLTAWVLRRGARAPQAAPAAAPAAPAVPAAGAPRPAPAPADETAALAAAAVAAVWAPEDGAFVVRSIRRVGAEESPWCQASRTDGPV